MANTIMQSLNLWKEGLILYESFESPSFMADQAWTLLNGVPDSSNYVAKSGLRSFKLDLTYPYIEKDFTPLGQKFRLSNVWFFDDATVTTGGFTPWVQWISDNSHSYGLGVDLAVSTVNYTKMVDGVNTDSGVARSSGFHRFDFAFVPGGPSFDLAIDSASVASGASTADAFSRVRLGVRDASGSIAFGYFDVMQCMLDQSLSVYGLQNGSLAKATLYDPDGAVISTQAVAGGSAVIALGYPIESPISGYLMAFNGAGIPYFRTPVQTFNPGDIYLLNVYDFGRKPSGWNFTDADARNDLKSIDGVKQSVFFHDSDRVTMTFADMTEQEKNDVDRWWTAAKRGNNFSVAIDGDALYFGNVTADNFDPTSSTVAVDSVLGAAAGSQMVIRDNDGYSKQTVAVASVDTALHLSQPPAEPALAGQQVRSLYYWPYCTSTDTSLPTVLTNLKNNLWTVTVNFEEAIQP